MCWIDESSAPGTERVRASFHVIHPFHPLFNREIELLSIRSTFGRRRVYYHQEDGRLRTIPVAWTDLAAPDVFREMCRGRSPFRPDDLVRLSRLIEGLRDWAEEERGTGGAGDA